MHAIGLGVMLSPFQNPSDEKEFGLEDLTKEEKELFTNVSSKLSHYFQRIELPTLEDDVPAALKTPLNGHQEYSLIFRQAKSWHNVEIMFSELLKSKTIAKVTRWVNEWREEITQLRTQHNSINDCIRQLQTCKRLKASQDDGSNTHAALLEKEKIIKTKILHIRNQILSDLKKRKQQLDNPEFFLKKNPSCQKIINFLKDNWDSLTLFSEWAEVGVDLVRFEDNERIYLDEKIFVQGSVANIGLNDQQILNKSIKAVFRIGETSSPTEIPLEYEGEEPGKIIRATIDVKQSHLASASPGLKKRSSSIQLNDELIFDFPLIPEDIVENGSKTVSEIARKLERIVQLAIKFFNKQIPGNREESSENPIKRLLVSFFKVDLNKKKKNDLNGKKGN